MTYICMYVRMYVCMYSDTSAKEDNWFRNHIR